VQRFARGVLPNRRPDFLEARKGIEVRKESKINGGARWFGQRAIFAQLPLV
jgi:hypothetical protein